MINNVFFFICFHLLICTTLIGQEWIVSIKPGAAAGIAAPFSLSKGFAYKTTSHWMPWPQLALELSTFKKPVKSNLIIGGGLQPVTNYFDFNEKNINLSRAYGATRAIGEYAIQLYAGLEKEFRNNKLPTYRNFFSVYCGIGLNYYYFRNEENSIKIIHIAETYNGQQLTGTEIRFSRYVIGAPSVITGFRYNIANSTGKTVASAEVAANFGLVRYFAYNISYQIDGEDMADDIPQKGWNLQFSLKIPVTTLRKNKK